MQYHPDYESFTTGISRESVLARKGVRNHLRGKWQHDPDFFNRFFPVDDSEAHIRKKSIEIKKQLYLESETNPRWPGFPKDPKFVDSRLYTALNNLLNNILVFFRSPALHFDKRLFIKTYRRKVRPDVNTPIWPGILFAATGLAFICSPSIRPIAHYSAAICPLEVVLEGVDMEVAQQRLATVVQEIFNYQPNRRYAFGLVISPRTLTCYLFDHSGVVTSPSLDYHTQPDQLCALVAWLSLDNPLHTGLDSSICNAPDTDCYINMGSPAQGDSKLHASYSIVKSLYHAPYIIGRGTTCFLAHRKDDPKTPYVIKDAWISTDDPELEGRESEASLLLHANSKGVVQGIAQVCHYEEVQFTDRDGKVLIDNIYNIRRLAPSEYPLASQRVHTRMVLSTYGKPLEEFSSRKEFLAAYYDAVRGDFSEKRHLFFSGLTSSSAHRNLYEMADILHRDIKPANILINSDGTEGGRGVLIDFDRAIRTDNASAYSLQKKIVSQRLCVGDCVEVDVICLVQGTHLFMSANALQGIRPQCYLDDLESFYYVLVYIVTVFTGPRRIKAKLPDALDEWLVPKAYAVKRSQLLHDDEFEVEPWFGAVFRRLVLSLQLIFRTRLLDAAQRSPAPPEPLQESDKFLSHIHQAIVELDNEEVSQPLPNVIPKAYPCRNIIMAGPETLAADRSLRHNVNYSLQTRHNK